MVVIAVVIVVVFALALVFLFNYSVHKNKSDYDQKVEDMEQTYFATEYQRKKYNNSQEGESDQQ